MRFVYSCDASSTAVSHVYVVLRMPDGDNCQYLRGHMTDNESWIECERIGHSLGGPSKGHVVLLQSAVS